MTTNDTEQINSVEVKQKKYIFWYRITVALLIFLTFVMFESIFVAFVGALTNPVLSEYAMYAVLITPLLNVAVCLTFFWYGWGLHKSNIKKMILLGLVVVAILTFIFYFI
jgi:hypothetical protein